ncbi:MAG: hypothetical protein MZV70_00645 [Desulfobacterales bacterium]|nr:hypothetical protein [Desulfobacterales bacterium]
MGVSPRRHDDKGVSGGCEMRGNLIEIAHDDLIRIGKRSLLAYSARSSATVTRRSCKAGERRKSLSHVTGAQYDETGLGHHRFGIHEDLAAADEPSVLFRQLNGYRPRCAVQKGLTGRHSMTSASGHPPPRVSCNSAVGPDDHFCSLLLRG